jgi:U3 small nucleolar RNA-associated protein 3
MAGRRYDYSNFVCKQIPINECTDALLEPSDEEVLGYSSESEDEDAPKPAGAVASSDEEELEEEDEDAGGWGSSRKDYYNNDNI